MCMVTVYKSSVNEENKVAEKVTRYTLDLLSKKLTVHPMLEEAREFEITKGVSWDESNDSMIIE